MEQADGRGNRPPAVFSVQHFCLQDGPGIRSIVFFKGCPLRCQWCQNPESWSPKPELAFKGHLCIGCETCVGVCPEKAVKAPGKRDPLRCRLCFTCAEECPTAALTRFGDLRTVDSLIEELRSEFPFYESSGGGVTFSGGEPLQNIDYIYEVSTMLKAEGVHIAVETAGCFDFGELERGLLGLIDLYLFDLKVLDAEKHKEYTGKSNDEIIRNFERLVSAGVEVLPRVPLIPGYTATEDNLGRIAEFLVDHDIKNYVLLSYNPSGLDKCGRLGRERPMGLRREPLTLEEERYWHTFFKSRMEAGLV